MKSYPFNAQRPTSSVFEAPETLVVKVDSEGNSAIRSIGFVELNRSDFTLSSLLLAGIDPSSVSFSSSVGNRFQKSQELDSVNLDSLFSDDSSN
ncbi:hypothetical protein [Dipodfec virus UA23Rod_920]|uniref:Uncharacterized protein n=1 Tax=Dipodfec virus UA23Rod_920 TaxID=2929334 RepID=A0A976R7M6_9VIRU|nr:hypothetical protein [Dipodfec virus UA23Rod_920]